MVLSPKDKLNGSAERFAVALRDMVREAAGEAAREAVEPVRDDLAKLSGDVENLTEEHRRLRTDMESGFKDAAEERRRLRSDMENGFAELRPPSK